MKQKILYLCILLFISLSSFAYLSFQKENLLTAPNPSQSEPSGEPRRSLQLSSNPYLPSSPLNSANDPIIIPIRDGFPYCETFTESSTRANTVIDGDAYLTANNEDPSGDGVLRLTRDTNNQNGYVYVDIPFPSRFGLKVSFEYFSYGSIGPIRADGLSFFMFDGALGQVPPDFDIGGFGGALGYTPLKGGGLNLPGLKGGYLGIGFDELGNFGNSSFGKYGSFFDPNQYTTSGANGKFYPHSVVIRGPVDGTIEPFYNRDRNNAFNGATRFKSYGFIDGKILNNYQTDNGLGFLYAGPPWFFAQDLDVYQNLDEKYFLNSKYPRFTIDAFRTNSPEDCLDEGYRKVFIDLNPDESSLDATGRPTRFTIQVYILANIKDVGLTLVQVFDSPVEYNFRAPNLLKVGFAGATGNNVNYHDISNVRVEVSDEELLEKPETEPLAEEVCEGDTNEFVLDVQLVNDEETAFIRCVQLYKTAQEALDAAINASANSIFPANDGGDPNIYCPFGTCQDFLCRPENLSKTVEEGTFEVFLVSDNGIETPKVKFKGNLGFSGEVTIYYTIVDNFGQVSDPQPITIIINPLPIPVISTIDPLIWEDFEENEILVRFEAEPKELGNQYQWFKNGNPIPGPVGIQNFYIAQGSSAPGDYTVEITTASGCTDISKEAIEIRLVRNIEPDLIEVREDCLEEGIVRVILDQPNVLGDEKWRIVDSNGVQVYPANDWTPIPSGTAEIVQGNLLAGDYRFQIGDDSREGQPGSDGNPLFRHDIPFTILPIEFPLAIINTSASNELCFEEGGIIQITADGGSGNYTYELIQNGAVVFSSPANIPSTTYEFTEVPIGDYEIRVSSGPRCEVFGYESIAGPDPIILSISEQKNVTCDPNDASVEWIVSGGTAPYDLISISKDGIVVDIITLGYSQNGNTFSFTGLEAGGYVLLVTDSRACETFQSETAVISTVPKPEITVSVDPEFCENEPLISIVPELTNAGLMTSPEYAWIIPTGERLTASTSISGVAYTIIDHDNNNLTPPHLTISGLTEGDYDFILELRGENSCDQDLDVSFKVNPQPNLEIVREEGAKCFGEVGGLIEVNVTNGDNSDFEFRLQGLTDWEAEKFIFDENISTGTYTIEVRNIITLCSSAIVATVADEVEELLIQEDELVDPTCNEDNGSYNFSVSGGKQINGDYRFVLNGNAISELDDNFEIIGVQEYKLFDLEPGLYELEVFDENDCFKTINFILTAQEVPEFSIEDLAICEGEIAILEVETVVLAGSSPVYAWTVENQSVPGAFIAIADNSTINGALHVINGNRLEVSGLESSLQAYNYRVEIVGPGVCPMPDMASTVTVFEIPEAVFAVTDVTCHAGNDGAITLQNQLTGDYTFTLLETGEVNDEGNFNNLLAGNYTIQIQAFGSPCPIEEEVTINQPDLLTLVAVDSQNPTCDNINGEIIFQINGGSPGYKILVNSLPIEDFDFKVNGDTYSIQNLAPGAYSVGVTDENGCTIPNPVLYTLTNDDGFPIGSLPIEVQICEGGSAILTPDLTIPAGATPVLRWYRDAAFSQQILTGTSDTTGSYIINSAGILTINGLGLGDYEYYLRISGPQICGEVTLATVKVLEAITFNTETEPINCFDEENGRILVGNIQGGNGIYELSLNGVNWQNELVFDNLPAGIYTVYVRDNSLNEGCQVIQSQIQIEGPDEAIQRNNPDIIRTSCGQSNGSIENLVISGGYGNYTFEWRKDDPVSGEVISGQLTGISDLAPGSYYLIVNDVGGCVEVFEFEIGQLSDPEYAIVPPLNVCQGSEVVIAPVHLAPNPSLPPAARTDVRWHKSPGQVDLIQNGNDPQIPGVNYTIDDSNWINPRLIIDGLIPGTYTYYFYVVCTNVEIPVEVTVHPTPIPIFEVSRETCFGENDGKITISSGWVPGLEFSVNGGVWESREALEARNFAPNSYTISTRTAFNCQPEKTVMTVEAASVLNLSLGGQKDAACGVPDGFIQVIISGGWKAYDLTLLNLSTNVSTSLSTSENQYTFPNLVSGTYQVEVRDAEGCFKSLTNPVVIKDGPTEILVNPLFEICESEKVSIAVDINPVANPRNFRWFATAYNPGNEISNGKVDGSISYQISQSGELGIEGLPIGDHTFFVTVEGPAICEGDIKKVTIKVYPDPQFTAVVENEVCFEEGGAIVINPVIAAANVTYSINGGPFTAYPNNRIGDLKPGTYTLTAKHGSGCTFTLNQPLTIIGPAQALKVSNSSTVDSSCGEANGQLKGIVEGGFEPYTLILKNENGIVINANPEWVGGSYTVSGLSVGSYGIEIQDSAGCVFILADEQQIIDSPTPLNVEDLRICIGEVATLTPTIPNSSLTPTFRWYFDASGQQEIPIGNSEINNVTYELLNTGQLQISGLPADNAPYTYYVEVFGDGICGGDMEEVLVKVDPLPQLRASNPSIICDPTQTVDLTQFIEGFNSQVYDYLVTGPSGNNLRLEDLKQVSTSGNYIVQMKFKNSLCYTPPARILVIISETEISAFFNYSIEVVPGFELVNQDINIGEDVSFIDDSKGDIIIWNWDFGDGTSSTTANPVHQFESKGSYEIRLTTIDVNGCQSEFIRIVEVFDDYKIMIPNAFTPSRGDGKNVYFKPVFRGISSMKFYIFNTWGELIYQTDRLEDKGWDGTLNGVLTPNGNYVYKAEFETRGGEKVSKTGVFILIR